MSYSKGLGASVGEGMGLFVQQFLGRQDQLKALAAQEEQVRQAAIQKEIENQRAAQTAELQRQQLQLQQDQFTTGRADVVYNRGVTEAATTAKTRMDETKDREDYYRNILSPQVSGHLTALDNDLKRYAPTLPDGRPNPSYNPAMFEATQTRRKETLKMWTQLGGKVGTGQDWDTGKSALLTYLGLDDPSPAAPAPTTAPAQTAAPVAPAAPQRGDNNMARGNAMQDGMPAPVAPPVSASDSASLPSRVQDVPPSQLMTLDDATLTARYGQTGMEYVNAARAEYATQQKAQQLAVRTALADNWTKQFGELSKREDLTPAQRNAMGIISALNVLPSLNPDQEKAYVEAVNTLQPAMYTAASWSKLLESKDPDVILGALPMYQQYAPNVVAGFDPTGLANSQGAKLSELDANVRQSLSAAGASDAAAESSLATAANTRNTTDINNLKLPGELAQQGATYESTLVNTDNTRADTGLTVAQTAGERADTNKTLAEIPGVRAATARTEAQTRQDAYDLGIKQVGQWAKTGATAYQLIQSNPDAWAAMKRDLGVTDSGLTALLAQGRFEYGRKLSDEDVARNLKISQTATEGARRAGIIATTAGTQADTATENATRAGRVKEIDTRVKLLDQQITESQKRGENIDSQIKERDGLLNEREGLLAAQAAAARGSAALSWANAARIPEQLKIERQRLQAYVASVKGNPQMDAAKLAEVKARTLLTRSKDPNDPLFSPALVNAKTGDPLDKLKKSVGVYYAQADQALKQVNSYQTQINSILSKGKSFSGGFDPEALTPADQAKLASLTASRDKAMEVAANRTATADQMLVKGMQGIKTGTTGSATADPYGVRDMGGVKMITQFPSKYPVPPTFTQEASFNISRTAGRLGVDANALAAVISFETGGSFSPAQRNGAGSSGTGLIQFMERTAKGMGTSTAALRAMPFDKQMEYVEKYLKGRGIGPGSSMADIYQAVAGSGYRRGSAEYEQNKVWDADKNGVIEANEQTLNPAFAQHVRDYFGTANAVAGPVASGTTSTTQRPPPVSTGSLPPVDSKITGVGPPPEVKPVGLVQNLAKRITRAAWVQAQGIESPQLAALWLTRTVDGLMPKGTPEQKATLRADLARTLDWAN